MTTTPSPPAEETSWSTSRLLSLLPSQRATHSAQVGAAARVAAAEHLPHHEETLALAGQLHDIGYAAPFATTGLHPLDGAAALLAGGYDQLIVHAVAFHSSATAEAVVRGIPREAFARYGCDSADAGACRSILTWADMTTGPTGERVTASARVAEVLRRYAPGEPVHQAITFAADWLVRAGSHPLATHQDDPWQMVDGS